MGISLDALLSVKLKSSAQADAGPKEMKPAASTPEAVKARRRLKHIDRAATPQGSDMPSSEDVQEEAGDDEEGP